MITLNSNTARFLNNIRICDNVPVISTVTNLAHLAFKAYDFFVPAQDGKETLYTRYIRDTSLFQLSLRAIPIIGQIFNAFENLYYTFRAARSGYRPPLSVMTSELGHTYVFSSLKNRAEAVLTDKPYEYMSEKKLYAISRELLKKGDANHLYQIIIGCHERLITMPIMQFIESNLPIFDETQSDAVNYLMYYFQMIRSKLLKENIDQDVLI